MFAETSGRGRSRAHPVTDRELANPEGPDHSKPMILIYSPNMDFCFSLSSFFQDRYDVITTTDPELLGLLAEIRSARLVVIDDEPSRRMIERLRDLRHAKQSLALMMLYVYAPGGSELDTAVRDHVDTVLYKPLNINEISRRIEELVDG